MAEPLPLDVASTLNALLTGSDQVSSALRAQLPYARAVGRCGCGCATVDVAVDHTAVPPAPAHGNPAADAWYAEPEDAGVMVFTKDGYLSLLETYSASSEPISTWREPRFVERIAAERSHQQYLDRNMNGYCGIGRTGVKPGDPFGTNWGASCPTGITSAED
ncbi:hypothetical protein [Streptomyces mirabilis]|uniref:hypothetical protein n=1 Tax=Streptomyces mirabilis TaxID=68239 RepID=UPI002B1CCC51|nr:hypothetical protein [Streptomyces mirabilis]